MTLSVFSALTIYAMATGWSPGPNNILLISMTGQFGFKKCLKFLSGICSGFLTIMLLCALFSVGINRYLPGAVPVLKYIGAAYIFYLAVRTFIRKPVSEASSDQKAPVFLQGFLLQFVNVKVILYGLSALSSYVLPYENSALVLVFFAFYLTFFGFTGNLIWALAGSLCKKYYNKYYRIFNTAVALLLIRCAYKLIF